MVWAIVIVLLMLAIVMTVWFYMFWMYGAASDNITQIITSRTWYYNGKPYVFTWVADRLHMNFYDDRGYFKGVAEYVFGVQPISNTELQLTLVNIVNNPSQIKPVEFWNMKLITPDIKIKLNDMILISV